MKKGTCVISIIAGIFILVSCNLALGQMVTASQDTILGKYEKSDKLFMKLRIGKIVSYFHQRMIGEAIVEKDFKRYQFDDTGKLIERTAQWRTGLPDTVRPAVTKKQAESMARGVVKFTKLYFISPNSDVYPIKPTPKNPCWVVRSIARETIVITIIDAMTGRKLGYGVPPPATGYSLSGPQPKNIKDCSRPWTAWYKSAQYGFEVMGYPTTAHAFPRTATIQGYIQRDDTAMFYELAHGGSWRFRNYCPGYTNADSIETWLISFASLPFAFIGSCDGMCDLGDKTLSYEFRKESDVGTVTIGYCGMSEEKCANCWEYSVWWQGVLFSYMAKGFTIKDSFDKANLEYPICAGTNDCMRFAGDEGLSVVPTITRSHCGEAYDGHKGPLTPDSRGQYFRCNIIVPVGRTLSINPHVRCAFVNNSKIIVSGILYADGSMGEIRFVSDRDPNKGMKFIGQIRVMNGGQIKVYE